VLLAEDNPINQQVASRMLERLGHSVVLAGNGREVLQVLARETFDLILMDVQMPEVDGFSATAVIRQQEEGTGRHVPIIALTAHAMKGDRERCLAAGMDGYLPKPIRPEELRQVLAALAGDSPNVVTLPWETPGQAVPPVLDREALLARVGNQQQRLCRLVTIFQDSCPGLLQAIRDALGRGDSSGLTRAAHTLKGSAGSLGGGVVFQMAKQLEELGRSGNLTRAAELVRVLENELDRFQTELVLLTQEEP
jgi:CheY-like chemotaxis protein